jgi:branched-chain amino acid transport system substrate-binding protein
VPPIDSPAYIDYLKFAGVERTGAVQHPFGSAGHDQMTTLLLAVESAGTDDVSVVKDHIRKVANGPGQEVTNLLDGLKALRAGQDINFSGASSDVDFKEGSGELVSRDFMLYEIKGGKDQVIEWTRSSSGHMVVRVDGNEVMNVTDRSFRDAFDGVALVKIGRASCRERV